MADKTAILVAIKSLAEIFPLKAGASIPAVADTWYRVLQDVPGDAFARAVHQYERSGARWFPTPGKIRELATVGLPAHGWSRPDTPAGRYKAWEQGNGLADGDPCPVCGSVLDQSGVRLTVQHDHDRHAAAGIGYAGPRGVRTGAYRDDF